MLNVPYMNYVTLCDVMNSVHAYVKYTSYVVLIVSRFYEVFLKGMMHDFKVKYPLEMHVFAWLLFLVHCCTNNILLHLFTQSVGYGSLKDVSNVKGLTCVSQAQGKRSLSLHYILFKVM